MIKKLTLLFLCWLCVHLAQATHIVGGELEMRHISGNAYRISMILYFDAVNGNPAALDRPTVRVHVFRKADNRYIQSYDLPFTSDQLVPYTNPACGIGQLITRRILYTAQFNFDPTRFSDPQGYYMVWERCCRNGVIDNIIAPGDAGQTFYLEFPPMIRNGVRFIDSSPQLFPPLSDYACVNQPFYFNFGGTDPDGDELVYSLVTPLSGNSSKDNPLPGTPMSAPYPPVKWIPGISQGNMIPGNPSLQISRQGILTLKPSRVGLFVFAVKCEEFRNGQKIGEVRRDFQMLVIDCKLSNPPSARLQLANGTTYNERDTIKLRLSDAKCADLYITDPDPNTTITARLLPSNFTNAGGILLGSGGTLNGPNDRLRLQVCFPNCPAPRPEGYIMDIVVGDNSCSVPLLDTVHVKVKILPEPNLPPAISTSLTRNPQTGQYAAEFSLGQTLNFDVLGNDQNGDTLTMSAQGMVPGMVFNTLTGRPVLKQTFSWTPPCNLLQANEASRDYMLKFAVRDKRNCDPSRSDSTTVRIRLNNASKTNNPPTTTTTLPYIGSSRLYVDTVYIGSNINFSIKGNDLDKDTVAIGAQGAGFQLGAQFTPVKGLPEQTTRFNWVPPCNALLPTENSKEFNFQFITSDFARCRTSAFDTARVRIIVKRRVNVKPSITTTLRYDAVNKLYYDTVVVGRELTFRVTGDDPDKDTVALAMQGIGINPAAFNMQFASVIGKAPQTGQFRWKTNCAMLLDTARPREFNLRMLVNDFDPCGIRKYDTANVRLVLIPDPKPNQLPVASTTLRYNPTFKMYIDTVDVGNAINFDVLGNDPDRDTLVLRGSGVGFTFASMGMNFKGATGLPPLVAPFAWQTSCEMLDIRRGEFQKEFLMNFVLNDVKECRRAAYDTTRVKLVLVYKPRANRAPVLTADQLQQVTTKSYYKEVVAGTTFRFTVTSSDEDKDSVQINASGIGFTLASGAITTTAPVRGLAPQQASFTWQPTCQQLQNAKDPKDYDLLITTRDFKGCASTMYDTIRVRLRVLPPPNPNEPTLRTNLDYDAQKQEYFRQVVPGEEVVFDVIGDDVDKDQITITGKGTDFNFADYKMTFTDVTGTAPQTSRFQWPTDCEMLKRKQEYVIEFTVTDKNPCNLNKSRTVRVRLLLRDVVNTTTFEPYNVFTPNGDGMNEAFKLPNIPVDNCDDQFQSIEIFNRWGRQVYKSNERNFSWDGKGFPSGVYYYVLKFKNSEYKGTVSLLGI